ncbi:hypothetical protein Tco_0228352 [Tanacetum coccineum]
MDDFIPFTWIGWSMRVQCIKGKEIQLVIGDDYSRFTMGKVLRLVGIFIKSLFPRISSQNGVVKDVSYTGGSSSSYNDVLFSKKAPCSMGRSVADIGKFQAKLTLGFSFGYAPSRKGLESTQKRNRSFMENIFTFTFDEMHQSMASMLALPYKELEMLFQPMFDEYIEQSRVNEPVPSATAVNAQVVPPGTSVFLQRFASRCTVTSASSVIHRYASSVQTSEITEEPTHEAPQSIMMFYILHITLLLEIQVRHSHHLGMLIQRNPTKLITHQIISEDGPNDHPWITSLANFLSSVDLPGNRYDWLQWISSGGRHIDFERIVCLPVALGIDGHLNLHCHDCNQEYDHLSNGCQNCFLNGDSSKKKSLSDQPEGFETRKILSSLSSEESSLWAIRGTIGRVRGIVINQAKYALVNLKKYGMDLSKLVSIHQIGGVIETGRRISWGFQLTKTRFGEGMCWAPNVPYAKYDEEQMFHSLPTRTDEQIVHFSVVNNREKQASFQCSKDSKEPHLSDISLAFTPVIPANRLMLPPFGKQYDVLLMAGEKTLGSGKPSTPSSAYAVGNRSLNLMLICRAIMWSIYSMGSRHFSHNNERHQKPVKEPKKTVTPLLILMDGFTELGSALSATRFRHLLEDEVPIRDSVSGNNSQTAGSINGHGKGPLTRTESETGITAALSNMMLWLGPDPEAMQEDRLGSNIGKLLVSLAGTKPEHMDVDLEQEMSEVKKTDHSADVLASIKSQVPTVVNEYLGTKLDDSLLKILERHTADLIEGKINYSMPAWPESYSRIKNLKRVRRR